MATRLYLPSTGTPAISPAFSSWTETGGADYREAVLNKISSAMTNKARTHTATAANSTFLQRAYLSPPLQAQTIPISTIKGTIRALESATNDNVDAMRIVVRVVSADGSTFRSPTLYGPSNSTVAEFNTSLRAKRMATGGATAAVTVSEGDRLFLEIGVTNTASGTSLGSTLNFGDNSGTDLGDNETDTAANNPFIEFGANIAFLDVVTETAPATDTCSAVVITAASISEAASAYDSPGASFPAEVDLLLVFGAGEAGNLVTPARLAAATLSADTGSWNVNSGGAALNHTRVTSSPITRRNSFKYGGTLYSSGYGFEIDMVGRSGASGYETFARAFNSGKFGASVCALFKFEALQNVAGDVVLDLVLFQGTGGGYGVAQQKIVYNGTAPGVLMAHGQVGVSSGRGQEISIPNTTGWYEIHLKYDYTHSRVQVALVDAITGVLVGSSEYPTDSQELFSLQFQDYLVSYGGKVTAGMVAVDWTTKAFPIGDFSLPAPTSLGLTQSGADELQLTWYSTGLRAQIERNDGSGWRLLEAWLPCLSGVNVYTDATVANGVTYTYRVTTFLNLFASSPATSSPVTVSNPATPAADILQWKMNDSGGSTIAATIGGNGTTNGTLASGLLALNGTSQYAQSSSPVNYGGAQNITITGWFNSAAWSSNGTARNLAESGADANGGAGRFQIYNAWGTIYISYNDAAFNQKLYNITGSLPATGGIHFYAFVLPNSTSAAPKLYIDGAEVGLTQNSNSWATPIAFATQTLNVGARNGGASNWFSGSIDDLRIHSGLLTAAQIGAIMNEGPDGGIATAHEFTLAYETCDATVSNGTVTASNTESAAATDTASAAVVTAASISEPAAATESQDATKATPATITETAAASDTSGAGLQTAAAVTEQAAATDAAAASAIVVASITETAAANSSQDALGGSEGAVVENASATDTASATVIRVASITESTFATDNPSAVLVLVASIAEPAAATDAQAATLIAAASIVENAAAVASQDALGGGLVSISEGTNAHDTCSCVVISVVFVTENATAGDIIDATRVPAFAGTVPSAVLSLAPIADAVLAQTPVPQAALMLAE